MATYHITRSVENGYILKNIELSEDGCRLFQFQERVRAFSKITLQTMLETAGLLVRSVHGDYDLGEYDEEYSERMIFIATKPEQ
jgi:non-homologous end joining protein Ku